MYKKSRNFFFLSILLISAGCRQTPLHHFEGFALGTFFSVNYTGEENPQLIKEVNLLLKDFSAQYSIFDSLSTISQFNKGVDIKFSDDFIRVINKSLEISKNTDGAFDITVEPLVHLWGFGNKMRSNIDSAVIDSLKSFIGYEKISIKDNHIIKSDHRMRINLNAIAKGFAADLVADYMEKKGYRNCLVEIGGEITARGTNNGKPWKVGIQVPVKEKNGAIAADYYFELTERSTATSGNYRNYFEENDIRYTHIIDPSSGKPEKTNLLSVTVIADDCMTADGYATAFMVMGLEKSKTYLANDTSLAALFIYDNNGTYKTYSTANFPECKKIR